jgi:hypothetical protein
MAALGCYVLPAGGFVVRNFRPGWGNQAAIGALEGNDSKHGIPCWDWFVDRELGLRGFEECAGHADQEVEIRLTGPQAAQEGFRRGELLNGTHEAKFLEGEGRGHDRANDL